jgi:beta-lactam-binding protein with PASTA domain
VTVLVNVEPIQARRINRRGTLLISLYTGQRTIALTTTFQPWRFDRVEPGLIIPKHRKYNLLLASLLAPTTTTVPNVVGLTQAAAGSALASAGLNTGTVTFQISTIVPAGQVISQTPFAGSSVPTGSLVNLVISSGAGFVLLQDAIFIAVNADLIVTQPIDWAYNPTVPYGYVISQSPPAGTVIPPFTPVHLVASLGPAPIVTQATVPTVTGLFLQDAQNSLTNSGCEWGRPVWQYSNSIPGNVVISQSVTAGTLVPQGTIVILTVSQGPPVTPLPGATVVVPLMH